MTNCVCGHPADEHARNGECLHAIDNRPPLEPIRCACKGN